MRLKRVMCAHPGQVPAARCRTAVVVFALAAVALGAHPAAYGDDKDVIAYRQHVMNTLDEQSAALGQILSTMVPEDNLTAHLQALALTAQTALKAFEPKVAGGESKPAVWTNWGDFAKRMTEFARKLNEAAERAQAGATDEVMTNIADTLDCKGCHDVYREEKK